MSSSVNVNIIMTVAVPDNPVNAENGNGSRESGILASTKKQLLLPRMIITASSSSLSSEKKTTSFVLPAHISDESRLAKNFHSNRCHYYSHKGKNKNTNEL